MSGAALSALSFICAMLLLALYLPLLLKTTRSGPRAEKPRLWLPNLAIAIWLFLWNFIHGVNSAVWSGNTVVRAPVWCDIVTKIVLSANMALPAGCVYLGFQLEHAASKRAIRPESVSRWFQDFVCVLLFLIVPLLYALLHILVQPHRFQIVENYGCQASIYPSTLAIVLMFFPPMLLSITAIVVIALVLNRAFDRHSEGISFTEHMQSRGLLSAIVCLRSAACIGLIALLFGTLYLVFINSVIAQGPQPWTSLAAVQANFYQIETVSARMLAELPDSLGASAIVWGWWIAPVLTVVFAVLTTRVFELIEDYRAFGEWVRARLNGTGRLRKIGGAVTGWSIASLSRTVSQRTWRSGASTDENAPIELRSGWDDTFDFKRSRVRRNRARSPVMAAVPSVTPAMMLPQTVPPPRSTSPDSISVYSTAAASVHSGAPGAVSAPLPLLSHGETLNEEVDGAGMETLTAPSLPAAWSSLPGDIDSLLRFSWPQPPTGGFSSPSSSSLSSSGSNSDNAYETQPANEVVAPLPGLRPRPPRPPRLLIPSSPAVESPPPLQVLPLATVRQTRDGLGGLFRKLSAGSWERQKFREAVYLTEVGRKMFV